MAQFDVHRLADGGLVVDCQHCRFSDIGTRFVVPLMPADYAPPQNERLNPLVTVHGETLHFVAQLAQAIRTRELKGRVASIAEQRDNIVRAFDTLLGAGAV